MGNEGKEALDRIHGAILGMMGECRICWVDRVVTRPHATYRCPKQTLSDREWQVFKGDLRFPKGVLCYFCLVPYCPPFDHPHPSLGAQPTPDLCDYPDALKELAYIIYRNNTLRKKVFAKLGIAAPSNLYLYKRYITKQPGKGELLGVYKVINAYLCVREEEKLA
jgi:hypothetical protein